MKHENSGNVTGKYVFLLLVLFGAGLLIRVSYLIEIQEHPVFQIPMEYQPDMGFNDNTALVFAQYLRKKFGLPEITLHFERTLTWTQRGNEYLYRPPAYTLFLGMLYFLLGDSQIGVRIAQMFLGLGSACLGYILGKQIYSRTAGFIIYLFMLFYWPLIIYENALHSPVMAIFAGTLFLVCAFQWVKRQDLFHYALVGFALSFYILSITALLPMIPLVIVWMLGIAHWYFPGQQSRSQVFRGVLIFLLSLAVPIGAVTCYNYLASGKAVLISGIAGMTLYIGNQPESQGYLLGCDTILDEFLDKQDHSLTTDEKAARVPWPKVSERAYDVAIKYISAHPGWFLRLSLKRAILFWTPKEISQNITEYCDRLFSKTIYYLPGNFTVVLCLAVSGLVFFLRALYSLFSLKDLSGTISYHFIPLFILISLVSVILYAPYTLLWVSAHFRAPLLPCLFSFAALGICESLRLLRLHRWCTLSMSLTGPVILLLVMVMIPVSYDEDIERWVYFRTRHYLESGQTEKAAEIARQVIERVPGNAFAQMTYANILLKQGDRQQALAHYELSFKQDKESAEKASVAQIIGSLRREFGDVKGAADIFNNLLRMEPDNYLALHELGGIAFEEGRYHEAIDFLEKARIVDPQKGNTYFLLGLSLNSLGKKEQAMAILEDGMSADPSDVWIILALADLKQESNASSEACALYKKVLKLNPDNPKALQAVAAICQP